MKKTIKGFALGAGLLMAAVLVAPPAGMAQQAVKRLMAENFGNVQKILIDLVRSDYAPVAREVGVIEEHAGDLVNSPPEAANINRPMFVSLAFSLQTHARSLRTVAEALATRDAASKEDGVLNIDYLRNTAAAHFGQMVTTCVACHNQFRRTMPK